MKLIVLIIAGFLGTILRYELGILIPVVGHFQLPTVIINLIGCLFLGWFFTAKEKWNIRPELALGIGTGFAGAFTTFSTFSLHCADAFGAGHFQAALLYIFISVAGGLLLTFVGIAVGKGKVS